MQYLRARHYSPEDNRFIAQDSYLGNLTQTASQNRYAYCENDPVNFADPSGYSKSGGSSGGSSSSSSSGGGRATDAYSSGDRFASAMGLDTRSGLPSYSAGMNMQNYSNSGGDSLIFVTKVVNGVSTTYMMVPANKYDYSKNPAAEAFKTTYGGRSYISLPMYSQSVPASTPNSTAMAHTNIQVTAQMAQLMVDQRLEQMGIPAETIDIRPWTPFETIRPSKSISVKVDQKTTVPLWEYDEFGMKVEAGGVITHNISNVSSSKEKAYLDYYTLYATNTNLKNGNTASEMFKGVKSDSGNFMYGEKSIRLTNTTSSVPVSMALGLKDGNIQLTAGITGKIADNISVTGYGKTSVDMKGAGAAGLVIVGVAVVYYAPEVAIDLLEKASELIRQAPIPVG